MALIGLPGGLALWVRHARARCIDQRPDPKLHAFLGFAAPPAILAPQFLCRGHAIDQLLVVAAVTVAAPSCRR
ncbi:MAG: hypothetical protein BRC31_02955 [Actinobacteria bacterium QS_5_72_10]|nr:MAG: hypothetical protein BRC31_02955 [Actinobacteria bacterium QS_5_72_10]